METHEQKMERFYGKNHICWEGKTCTCSIQALEPDEDCPVHSGGPWPPRCAYCGRFMKWSTRIKT